MGYRTKGAVAAAKISHNHEGGRLLAKTFRLIGTVRFLTDGVKTEPAEQSFDFMCR